jgi:hypothetical protein
MIRGEFEDAELFAAALAAKPDMASWSGKEICDGLSGATLQAKSFARKLPARKVSLKRRAIAYADGFGQYWLSLPPGSYVLVGSCGGYRDAAAEVTVAPGSVQYLNFYMKRRFVLGLGSR